MRGLEHEHGALALHVEGGEQLGCEPLADGSEGIRLAQRGARVAYKFEENVPSARHLLAHGPRALAHGELWNRRVEQPLLVAVTPEAHRAPRGRRRGGTRHLRGPEVDDIPRDRLEAQVDDDLVRLRDGERVVLRRANLFSSEAVHRLAGVQVPDSTEHGLDKQQHVIASSVPGMRRARSVRREVLAHSKLAALPLTLIEAVLTDGERCFAIRSMKVATLWRHGAVLARREQRPSCLLELVVKVRVLYLLNAVHAQVAPIATAGAHALVQLLQLQRGGHLDEVVAARGLRRDATWQWLGHRVQCGSLDLVDLLREATPVERRADLEAVLKIVL